MPAFRAMQVLRRLSVLRAENVNFLTVQVFRPPQSQHPGWCMADTQRVTRWLLSGKDVYLLVATNVR